MKKLFLLVIGLMVTALSSNAQMSCETYNPDLTFMMERCVVSGDKATITLRVTNVGQTDLRLNLAPQEAYDDEANMYTYGNFRIINNQGDPDGNYMFNLPSETSVRFTLIVNGVSRASTEFIRLNVLDYNTSGMLKFKHLPITRM